MPAANPANKHPVAVWSPLFGEEGIADEKPYTAVLSNGVWFVDGSLPENTRGGTAHAVISKEDGRILEVFHTQ